MLPHSYAGSQQIIGPSLCWHRKGINFNLLLQLCLSFWSFLRVEILDWRGGEKKPENKTPYETSQLHSVQCILSSLPPLPSQCHINYMGKPWLPTNFDRQPFTEPPMMTLASGCRKEFSVSRIHLHSNWQGFGLSLCFILPCPFKLTVSSVVLLWPRVTFSSADLLWMGTNCIRTKAMAVNVPPFTRECQNLFLCTQNYSADLCCELWLRHVRPYLFFTFSYC